MEVSLKEKVLMVKEYLKGLTIEEISKMHSLEIENVKKIINEWSNGYFQISENDYYIRQLAGLIKEKEINMEDLAMGYYYYTLLRDYDREKTLKIILTLAGMDDQQRKLLLENTIKMMKLKNYSGIDYSEIPAALDRLVKKAKEIREGMNSMEKEVLELEIKKENLQKELVSLENELKNKKKYLEIIKFIEENFDLNHEEAVNFLREAKALNYEGKRMIELAHSMELLRNKNLSTEQFLKISEYLEKLMDMGFTISFLKELEMDIEKSSIKFQKYLREMDLYVKDKIEYERNVEDLKKEAKSLENQIRSMRNEIREYLKKVKPKMK